MYLNQVKPKIIACINAGISVELISGPGIGKSEVVQQLVDEQSASGTEWGLSKLFLATSTPPDLMGYIFKGERRHGDREYLVSEPCMPGWMITTDGKPLWAYKRGVVFLDEYGQGESDVKRASAELFLNGQLGPWRIPEGWGVVAASNRSKDRSGVTKNFDFVINRRVEVHISPDLQAWKEWALKRGVHPFFVFFAEAHPDVVFQSDIPKEQGPWCTPRSFMMAERLLVELNGGDRHTMFPTDPGTRELVSGLLGEAATQTLFQEARLGEDLPKYDDVVKFPETAKLPTRPDAQMLLVYQCAARVSGKDFAQVTKYIERMAPEFSVTFITAATERDKSLISTRTVSEWCSKHAHLVALIQPSR